jgi:hypothetical protein
VKTEVAAITSCAKILAASLRVEINGGTTIIEVESRTSKAVLLIATRTEVWREFCRRQLELPPPLPREMP